jgi:hypothetical protein
MTDKTWTQMDAEVAVKGFALGEVRGEVYARTRVRGWDLLISSQGTGETLVQKPGAPDPEYTARTYGEAVEWVIKKGDYAPVHEDDAIDDLLDGLAAVCQDVDHHDYGLPTRSSRNLPYSDSHLKLRAAVRIWLKSHGAILPVETNDEYSEGKIPGAGGLTRIGYISNQSLSSLRLVSTTGAVRIVKDLPNKGKFREVFLKEGS